MAAAIPFVVGVLASTVVKEVVSGMGGNENLSMIAGAVAGYWSGTTVADGMAGSAAGSSSEVVAGGQPALGSESPQSFGEIGGSTDGIDMVGDGGAQLFDGADSYAGATAIPGSSPGLLESAGGWIEKNPMAASMGFQAVSGIAGQKMAEDEAREAEKRAIEREESRYARDHTPIDPSNVPRLDDMNRGLIEGGYQSPGTRVRESRIASSDLPNYRQLLDRYKRKV